MIELKLISTEDFYPSMKHWATKRGFPLPPLSFLPTNTVVAFNPEGDPVYSICVYHTDSEVMWIGWEVSDPDSLREHRHKGVEHILNYIKDYAKVHKYKHILTTSSTPVVERALKVAGFIEGDREVNQYIKNI